MKTKKEEIDWLTKLILFLFSMLPIAPVIIIHAMSYEANLYTFISTGIAIAIYFISLSIYTKGTQTENKIFELKEEIAELKLLIESQNKKS